MTAYITSLYGLAKDSSGPLKPGVVKVEGTVKTVVGPLYQKIEGKPLELLVFVDGKVGSIIWSSSLIAVRVRLNLKYGLECVVHLGQYCQNST